MNSEMLSFELAGTPFSVTRRRATGVNAPQTGRPFNLTRLRYLALVFFGSEGLSMTFEDRELLAELDLLSVLGGPFFLEDEEVSKASCGRLADTDACRPRRKQFFGRERGGRDFFEAATDSVLLDVIPWCKVSMFSLHPINVHVFQATGLTPESRPLRLREAGSEAAKQTRLVNLTCALRGIA